MLRERLGDERFWRGIRLYYARYLNATASTDDFMRAMEEASGDKLQDPVPVLVTTVEVGPEVNRVVIPVATEPSDVRLDPGTRALFRGEFGRAN